MKTRHMVMILAISLLISAQTVMTDEASGEQKHPLWRSSEKHFNISVSSVSIYGEGFIVENATPFLFAWKTDGLTHIWGLTGEYLIEGRNAGIAVLAWGRNSSVDGKVMWNGWMMRATLYTGEWE